MWVDFSPDRSRQVKATAAAWMQTINALPDRHVISTFVRNKRNVLDSTRGGNNKTIQSATCAIVYLPVAI